MGLFNLISKQTTIKTIIVKKNIMALMSSLSFQKGFNKNLVFLLYQFCVLDHHLAYNQ